MKASSPLDALSALSISKTNSWLELTHKSERNLGKPVRGWPSTSSLGHDDFLNGEQGRAIVGYTLGRGPELSRLAVEILGKAAQVHRVCGLVPDFG